MTESTFQLVCCNPEWAGNRLDKFLFSQFPEYSRAYFQELIDQGMVLINQKPVIKSNYSIKPNDRVSITFKTKQSNLNPVHVAFQVLAQTDDFLIINKPAGLLVHQSASDPNETTLVNGLLYHFKEIGLFDDTQRPGIVHRIDKQTSGLLLVARHPKAHIALSALFKTRHISKTYLAVVKGHPPKEGTIDYPIGRHVTQRHKMTIYGINSRPAITNYKVLAYYKDSALIAASIITGRTHQIRVHCAAIGHGLLGDATYGHETHLIKRQALHAWKMSFEFKEVQHSYCHPVPDDMKELLKQLNSEEK